MIDVTPLPKIDLVDKGSLIIKKMIYKLRNVAFRFKRMNSDNSRTGIFLLSNEIEINVTYFDCRHLST